MNMDADMNAHAWGVNVQSREAAIIGIVATTTGADVDKFKAAGINSFLTKPISREELRAKIAAAAVRIHLSLPPSRALFCMCAHTRMWMGEGGGRVCTQCTQHTAECRCT